jgi:LmbE family N-acetylglucosaminyl deacetylase
VNRVVIVAAHPDDEVIGAGAILAYLRDVYIIHTTDGSPRDLSDALRSGFATREEYAEARRRELGCALSLAGIPGQKAIPLGFTDKETMHQLPELCRALAEAIARLKPDIVLTQPYEGGHPDHDSTAFAVHRCFPNSRRLFEMTSYHSQDGALITGSFLPGGEPGTVREFTQDDKLRKARMLACFRSQAAVLQYFPLLTERFRRAPRYDFTQPPHAGPLHYERLPWGITGQEWRKLAAQCR